MDHFDAYALGNFLCQQFCLTCTYKYMTEHQFKCHNTDINKDTKWITCTANIVAVFQA